MDWRLRPALLGRLGRFNVMITCHLQATDATHSTQAEVHQQLISRHTQIIYTQRREVHNASEQSLLSHAYLPVLKSIAPSLYTHYQNVPN